MENGFCLLLLFSPARQFRDMRSHGFAQRFEVVTTFETRDQPALAGYGGPLLHGPGHINEVFIFE